MGAEQQPPGPPSKQRPTSMGSILRRTTGRALPPSAPPEEAPQEGQVRRLADVPWEQVSQAVADMCTRLSVPGSESGLYDLYAAVAGEWGKAHTTRE